MAVQRVVCLSDTHLRRHGGLPAWCLRRLAGADLILHAGDLVARPVLEELMRLAPVTAVHGNMDELVLKEVLPERRVAELGGVRIGLVHDPGPALGRAARLVEIFPDCDAVVYGHTHDVEVRRLGERLILNPGSPTSVRGALGPTMIELSLLEGKIEAAVATP